MNTSSKKKKDCELSRELDLKRKRDIETTVVAAEGRRLLLDLVEEHKEKVKKKKNRKPDFSSEFLSLEDNSRDRSTIIHRSTFTHAPD